MSTNYQNGTIGMRLKKCIIDIESVVHFEALTVSNQLTLSSNHIKNLPQKKE